MLYVVDNQQHCRFQLPTQRGPTQLADVFFGAELEILNLDSPNPKCQCEAMGRVRENRLWPGSVVTILLKTQHRHTLFCFYLFTLF